jgi:hypothetical protein
MEANIIFENVKAYNVIKFDVKLGESFKVELIESPGKIRWFSDNDPVLNIVVDENGSTAMLTSNAIGKSEIQLQHDGEVTKTLYVEVYDRIAVSLNPIAKSPILKN